MASHIDQYTSLFSQLKRVRNESAIQYDHKALILLSTIDRTCALKSAVVTLRTKNVSELSWDYFTTTFIDEFNAKYVSGSSSESKTKRKRSCGKKPGTYPTKTFNADDVIDWDSDTGSTCSAFAAALTSVETDMRAGNKNSQCDFYGKSGHTEDRCYNDPSNPDNKLPPKNREMLHDKAAAAVG